MKAIWKYRLEPTFKVQTINMPLWAEILHVDSQNNTFCLWALVDTEAEKSPRSFAVVGTGHPCDHICSGKYLGTLKVFDDLEIYHIFEV